jgi:hypothetical protein
MSSLYRVNKVPYITLKKDNITIAFHNTDAKGMYYQKHFLHDKLILKDYLDLTTLLYIKDTYARLGFVVEWPETPEFFEAE